MPLNSHNAAFRRLAREAPGRTTPSPLRAVTANDIAAISRREPKVTEFHAVPEALHANAAQLHEVAQSWVTARTALTETGIDPALIGGNTAPSNNPMLQVVLDRMEQSYLALSEAVQMLKTVAEGSANHPGTCQPGT